MRWFPASNAGVLRCSAHASMGIEIIPTILVKTQEDAEKRITTMEGRVPWMQIDVVDGKFAPNLTWGDPLFIKNLNTTIRFEIDLMVMDPETQAKAWLEAVPRVGRIYFHQEAAGNRTHNIITRIQKAGAEAGIAINPKTKIEVLYPFATRADAVLLLGVDPGFYGSPFYEETVERVVRLHEKFPNLPITVDGGVNPERAQKLALAGASRLAVGSFIWNSGNPVAQWEALSHASNEKMRMQNEKP